MDDSRLCGLVHTRIVDKTSKGAMELDRSRRLDWLHSSLCLKSIYNKTLLAMFILKKRLYK